MESEHDNDFEENNISAFPAHANSGHYKEEQRLDDINHLPLMLHVDLGSVTIPLDDLRRLASGNFIRLNSPSPGTVSLRVENQTIGKGELVEVDGQLAVRILQLWRNS